MNDAARYDGSPPEPPYDTEPEQRQLTDIEAMLWKWFEDRGAIDRSAHSEGLTAEDFKTMLDEHESALQQTGPKKS